ncbi:MAG TPA: tetratricopeptide repeat protein, partial [Bacteroidia bacterium]|nr:tetratricopeptide repeat protein [Bacteroidia bacterium]
MRNIHLSIVSMFVIVAAVMSGCKTASIEEGHKAYDTRRYADAAEIYKEVLGEQPKESKGELTFKVAECYRLYNSYKNAERWYERAEKANYGPEATKMRAEMLKRQGMYTEA